MPKTPKDDKNFDFSRKLNSCISVTTSSILCTKVPLENFTPKVKIRLGLHSICSLNQIANCSKDENVVIVLIYIDLHVHILS